MHANEGIIPISGDADNGLLDQVANRGLRGHQSGVLLFQRGQPLELHAEALRVVRIIVNDWEIHGALLSPTRGSLRKLSDERQRLCLRTDILTRARKFSAKVHHIFGQVAVDKVQPRFACVIDTRANV